MSGLLVVVAAFIMSTASAQRGLSILRREQSYQSQYDESIRFAERPDPAAASTDPFLNNFQNGVGQRRELKKGKSKGLPKAPKGPTTLAPTISPTITAYPTMAPTVFSPSKEVKFFQLPASATVYTNSTSPDPQALGTVFIYNDVLYDQNTLTQINNTFVSGLCTRTQQRQDLGNGQFIVGAGYCSFTYTLVDSNNNTATFNTAGEVFDQFGGVLGVQGGTAALVGVYGQIQLSPVTVTNTSTTPYDGDFFTGATGYEVNVTLELIDSNFTTAYA